MLQVAALVVLLAQEMTTIYEVEHKYEPILKRIEGVTDVSVGGVDDDLQLVVQVSSNEARQAVEALTGSKLSRYPVRIIVSAPPAPPAVAAKPSAMADCCDSEGATHARECHHSCARVRSGEITECPHDCTCGDCNCCRVDVATGVATPAQQQSVSPTQTRSDGVWKPPQTAARNGDEECDLVREILGLPKRVRQKGEKGQPCNWYRTITFGQSASLAGPGEVSPWYPRHRRTCPFTVRRLLQRLYGSEASGTRALENPVPTGPAPTQAEPRPVEPPSGGGIPASGWRRRSGTRSRPAGGDTCACGHSTNGRTSGYRRGAGSGARPR